mgnify:FL=1
MANEIKLYTWNSINNGKQTCTQSSRQKCVFVLEDPLNPQFEKIVLELEEVQDVFARKYRMITTSDVPDVRNCEKTGVGFSSNFTGPAVHYRGKVLGSPSTRVALTVCQSKEWTGRRNRPLLESEAVAHKYESTVCCASTFPILAL